VLLVIRDAEPSGDGRISFDKGARDRLNRQGFVRRCNRLAHFLSVSVDLVLNCGLRLLATLLGLARHRPLSRTTRPPGL
jgi:hypothetical protein